MTEVSRSLDDEDEDPDELGSDEADNGSPTAKRVSASLNPQSKPEIPQQESAQFKAKLQSPQKTPVSLASTNSSRKGISDKNFAKQKITSRPTKSYKHITTKSHTRRPSIEDSIHSKLSQKGVTRQEKTVLRTSKGVNSRVNTLIAKNTNLNREPPVDNAPGHSDAVHKVSKMVGSAGAKTKVTVIPTQKSRNDTGQRQESQITHTGTNSRSAHDVTAIGKSKGSKYIPTQKGRTAAHQRQESQTAHTEENSKSTLDDVAIRESKGSATHQRQESQATHTEANSKSARDVIAIKESKGSKGSRFGEIHHKDDFKNPGSASSKKWFSSRFSEFRMGEASSHNDESSTSEDDQRFSGDDHYFNGEGDLSGDENSSGAVRELSISDSGMSRDDGKVITRGKEVNDGDADWSGYNQDFSGGESDFSGEDDNLSGTDGNLSGNLNSILKISDAAVHPHESEARGKADGKTRKTGHADNKKLTDSGKGTEERKRPQNKASVEKNKERDKEIKKSDLVEDLDDLGSDDEDSKATSREIVRLPQKTNISKIVKHGKETHNGRIRSKELTETRKKIDLVEDLDDLGSDDEDSKAASGKPVEFRRKTNISKTVKHDKDNQNKRLKSKELGKTRKKIDLVGDIGLDDDGSGMVSRNGIGLLETRSSWQAMNHGKSKENGRRMKSNMKKTNKINLVEDSDDLGSDDDDSKVSLRTFVRLGTKSNIPKVTKHDKKTDNEEYLTSKEGGNTKKTDHVEDPDDLGSDDDDMVKSKLEHSELASRKGAGLLQITSRATSLISKTTKNATKAGNERTNSKEEEGRTRQKIDLLKDLDELGADDNDSFRSKDEHRKAISSNAASLSQKSNLVKSPILKKGSTASPKSGSRSVQPKLRQTNTKKASNTFAKEIRKPNDSNNKLNNISTFKVKPHHTTSPANTSLVKSNENIPNESSLKEKDSAKANTAGLSFKSGKNVHRITTTEEWKAKPRYETKKTTSRPLVSNTGKHVKQFGIKKTSEKGIKTKINGTRLADKSPKTRQSNVNRMKKRTEHRHQPVAKKNHATVTQSGKATKVAPSSNVQVRHSVKQTENEKMLMQASVNKIKYNLKDRIASTTQVTSPSDVTVAKSVMKAKNTKNTFKEPETLSAVQGKKTLNPKKTPFKLKSNHKLGRQITPTEKKGKIKSLNISSKLEDVDDLMRYARRKGSAKHQGTVRNHLRSFAPTKKRAKLVKTATPQQQHKSKPNRNKTMQGQPKMSAHPNATKRFKQKEKSSHEKRPHSQHLPSVSLTKKGNFPTKHFHTTPSISSRFVHPATMDQVSSKNNRSFPFHPTFSRNIHAKSEGRSVSLGNNSAFNKAFLSIKQRSNENVLDTKAGLLSHFHKVVNGTDGVEFSVRSGRKHHKGKHSMKDGSIDVEDLGDADFDIMMSNDIPHKDLPKKAKGHKHTADTKEKERGVKIKGRGKGKKDNKKEEKEEDGDDSEESGEKSSRSHSQKEEDKSKERKNLHHRKTDHGDDNDGESHSSKEEDDNRKHKRTRSHHSKNDKSNSEEQNGIERGHHHKKHKHKAMATEKDDSDDGDDNYSAKRVKHKKKHHKNVKTEGDSKDAVKTERRHHHHHHHKTHVETLDDNNWVGKIIPGKVKVTYEEDSSRKRHRKHKIQHEKKEAHPKRKHKLKARENRKDESEETEVKNSYSRGNHKHHVEGDEYKKREKHTRYHKDREEDEGREKAKKEDNEERQEDVEKSTDVNYEAVKTGRRRFFHHEEDDEGRHHEEQEKHRKKGHIHRHDDNGDDEDNSSKKKYDDRDDDNNKSQKSDDSRRKNNDDADEGNVEKDERHREKAKDSRVVLGEDSESEDEDDKKHLEQSERRHHEHKHGYERDGDEREDVRYHSEDHKSQHSGDYHKSTLHNRHHHERHWESKPRHHESHFESKELDNDDNDVTGDRRRNFRNSFIYHKDEDEERRSRQHHDSTRHREEQRGRHMNANSEYHNEDQDREFNANEHHRHPSYHHRHHRYKPRVANDRKDEKDHYEPSGVEYYHEVQHDDEPEHFPRHHKINEDRENEEPHYDESESFHRHQKLEHRPTEESENNYANFQREKEAHRAEYVSHEDDQDGWKFKAYHNRYPQGDSHQRQEEGSHDHRFIGDDGPPDHFDYHSDDYNGRHKFRPKHRKKGHWKDRQRYHKEEYQYEDSGGSFDASSWNPSENYNDDSFYGGEGNYHKKKHWKKHWKHKHRKDRQSYDYWGYGDQNPYYYDYRYHKFPSRYEHYPPQPSPPFDWHNRYKSYDRWKPKPSNWYPAPQHWEKKESWRHHPKWRQFQENRPTGYQWNNYYNDNSNGDERYADQPKPTSNPGDPSSFFRPTNPRWQQPDATGGRFRENHRPLGQNRGPDKQYQDWSQSSPSGPLRQDENGYSPQEHPSYGPLPRPQADVPRPDGQMQPTGVQSKYVPPASQQIPSNVSNQTRFRPTVRRQYLATPPAQVSAPTNISKIKNLMDKLNSPPSAIGSQQPSSVSKPQNKPNIENDFPRVNLPSNNEKQDRNRLNGFFKEENAGKKSNILRPANNSKGLPTRNSSFSGKNYSVVHVEYAYILN